MTDPTVTFRNNIGAYTGKGSRLTAGEVDTNFYNLLVAIIALQNDGAFGVSVSFNGASLTFNWTDGTQSGPYRLPTAVFNPAGEWTNSTTYHRNDVISVNADGYYLVLEDHTTDPAPATFNANATEGTGADPVYQQISAFPDMVGLLRYKGFWTNAFSYEQYDVVQSATYGLFVVLSDHVSAATFDPDATGSGGSALYRRIAPPAFSPVEELTATTKTLALTDVGKYFRCPNGCTVSFPDDPAFVAGSEIHFRQTGDLPIVFVGEGTSVTLNPQRQGYDTTTLWKGSTVTAKCISQTEWDLIGAFGEQPTA